MAVVPKGTDQRVVPLAWTGYGGASVSASHKGVPRRINYGLGVRVLGSRVLCSKFRSGARS